MNLEEIKKEIDRSASKDDAEENLEEANDFFEVIRAYLKKEINL